MAKAWRSDLEPVDREGSEAIYASAVSDTARSNGPCSIFKVVSTVAVGGHTAVLGLRALHAADAIDDLSLDRIAFPAKVRHMHGERAVAHRSGAALGEFVQELGQAPPVMRASSENTKNH